MRERQAGRQEGRINNDSETARKRAKNEQWKESMTERKFEIEIERKKERNIYNKKRESESSMERAYAKDDVYEDE